MYEFLFLMLLVGMVLEAAREAYGTPQHFTRMMPFTRHHKPERDFWTARHSIYERRVHQKRWHIDLLGRRARRR